MGFLEGDVQRLYFDGEIIKFRFYIIFFLQRVGLKDKVFEGEEIFRLVERNYFELEN